MKTTKIRPGLYRVTTETHSYLVEDRSDIHSAYPWRLSDEDAFHDPWRGCFATKRDAIAEISNYLIPQEGNDPNVHSA